MSAFWGLLALGLLYAGLTRWRSLRLAGLAVFGVALGKLFLFDLSSLSSITRALSFLAVGGDPARGRVLLQQRLAISLERKVTEGVGLDERARRRSVSLIAVDGRQAHLCLRTHAGLRWRRRRR